MRIQHNIMAMNSYRNLSGNNNALSKNLEKLSSGYRINRAGDDAAGLAISEKMRAQISGLDQAQKNAQSGINLVKTAEGALTEVHDMLNRMTTLATQSANGTYETADREKLQAEIDALIDEIDRIADNSNFNGTKLLNGELAEEVKKSTSVFSGGTTIVASASATVNSPAVDNAVKTKFEVSLDNVEFDFVASSAANTVGLVVGGTTLNSSAITADTSTVDLAKNLASQNASISINGVTYDVVADGNKLVFTMSTTSADALTAGQAASFAGNFDVSITTSAGTYGKILGTVNVATQLKQQGSAAAAEVLATAKSNAMTTANLTDGAAFQIGNQQYVLALTDETAEKEFASDSVTVVDLRDLFEKNATSGALELKQTNGNTNENFDKALNRIVDAMGNNEMFTVGLSSNKELTFQERSEYDGDVDLTDKNTLLNQFKMGGTVADNTTTVSGEGGKELQLQIGASKEEKIGVNIESMKAESLGIQGLDITDVTKANAAIDTIKAAIEKVSVTRGDLGAIQNRLEHTINNLGVMEENIQDAESNIRDTDIAEEMMAYTKNNILIQSAQAMLAQANQVPQGVLQLMG